MAIKLLPPNLAEDKEFAHRFRRNGGGYSALGADATNGDDGGTGRVGPAAKGAEGR